MYRRILVPLDGSPFAEHALPVASTIARSCGAALCLAQVHVPLVPAYMGDLSMATLPVVDDGSEAERGGAEQAYLDARAQELTRTTGLSVSRVLLDGPITEALTEYVVEGKIDLVVMTTHGRGGLARVWLGSVADAFVRHSHVPVLLIRPHEGMIEITSEHPIKRILIPLDGSPLAEQILEAALAIGKPMQAEFTLLQVVEPLMVPGYAPLVYTGQVAQKATEELREAARSYLQTIAERLTGDGANVRTQVVLEPAPARAILEVARQQAVDLIAMATHGRGGVTRVLIGSVADKVLRGADAAVLLDRPSRVKEQAPEATTDRPESEPFFSC